jgi:chaperonin GroES
MLKPLGSRVLVKPDPVEEVSKSGAIVLPEVARDRPQTGRIVEVSEEITDGTIQVNQRVMFGTYAGTPVKDGDEQLLLINVSELLCVVYADGTSARSAQRRK